MSVSLPGQLLVWAVFAAIGLFASVAGAQTSSIVDRSALRVCSDPANMPFSNERRQGFENKIAELLGKKLNLPVVYTWFPQATGFVRRTLQEKRCDIIMGYAQGHELVLNTNHYYRSVYVMIHRSGSDLDGLADLADPRLKSKKIGIVAGTPPATVLALNGLLTNAVPFKLVVDRRHESPAAEMIEQLESGLIDVAILWGPIGGYLARNSDTPMTVTALPKPEVGPRMAFRITFGVRRTEVEWKRQLNEFISENQDEINRILQSYGVSLIDENDNPIIAQAMAGVEEPAEYRQDKYRSPVPETLKGAAVVSTAEAEKIWKGGKTIFIDVLPRAPKPANLPEGTVWRDKKRSNIPGSIWLPNVGYGELHPSMDRWFRDHLARLTGGDRAKPILIYCLMDCWMSWNAAKRAMEYGYTNVTWYPEGTDGWTFENLPVEVENPEAFSLTE